MRYRRISYEYVAITSRLREWPYHDAPGPRRWSVRPHACWSPPCDVYETAEGLTATLELAGVREEDIEVLLYANAVVVQGLRQLPRPARDGVFHAAEIPQGPFRAEIPLPWPADQDRVQARLDRGLLHLHIPRLR